MICQAHQRKRAKLFNDNTSNQSIQNKPGRGSPEKTGTAAETYAFFLDSFLRLYREHSDILRFNQHFNIYVKARGIDAEELQPYSGRIDAIRERFHAVYLRGQQDGTLRTDIPEEKIFSATLHLMLAAVTRYAVGLSYETGVDPEEELMTLRNMLYREYTSAAPAGIKI